jgi:peroxiredoxin
MRKLAIFVVVVALAVLAYKKLHRPAQPASASAAVPELSLTDLNGNTLPGSSYKGKVLLVSFWAAWCTSCAEDVPHFMALQKKYQQQGLQVLGFSVDDDAQELRDFYFKYQMNYPVIASNPKIADAFGGIFGLPTTILVDSKGMIRARYNGSVDFPAVEREVVALLRDSQS